jgi:hypothetical protein
MLQRLLAEVSAAVEELATLESVKEECSRGKRSRQRIVAEGLCAAGLTQQFVKNHFQITTKDKRRATMDFKAEIKGGNLIITIPVAKKPEPSKSGKTKIVASTNGNVKTDIKVEGYPLTIGVNAYITNAEYVPPAK